MENVKNVLNKNGRLASVEDLEDELCCGYKPMEDILQLVDGVYKWISEEQQRKILEKDEDIEEWELQECQGEYVKISDGVPEIYKKFVNELDEEMNEEVISCTFCSNSLMAITQMVSKNVIYIYNMWLDNKSKIQTQVNIVYQQMLCGVV